jgi:PST family polysaccharide transporter
MIKKWKNKIGLTGNRKVIFSNFISLSLLQAVNYIIPLVALPYIIRLFGDERFGLLMFALAFVQYFFIIVDFGLEYTATREVSVNRDSTSRIHELFNAVFALKLILFLISTAVFLILVFSIERFEKDSLLYILTYGMVLGQMLFPVWLFQGLEKMKFITWINVFSKLFFTLLIFIFIKTKEDYYLYPVFNSLGYIVAGITSFIMALKLIRHKFFVPSKDAIQEIFKQTKNVFLSNLGISLYITSTPFLLGLVTNKNELVGYFSIAEKTIRSIRYMVTPVSQALFPYLSKKFSANSAIDSIKLLHKIALLILPFLLILTLMVLVFNNEICLIIFGEINNNVILNLKILSAILVVGTFNNLYGVLGLINMKLDTYFRNYVLLSGLFNILVCLVLSATLFDLGASLSVILTEILLFILIFRRFYIIQKNYEPVR